MEERNRTDDRPNLERPGPGPQGSYVSLEDLPTSLLASLSGLCASARTSSHPEGHHHG